MTLAIATSKIYVVGRSIRRRTCCRCRRSASSNQPGNRIKSGAPRGEPARFYLSSWEFRSFSFHKGPCSLSWNRSSLPYRGPRPRGLFVCQRRRGVCAKCAVCAVCAVCAKRGTCWHLAVPCSFPCRHLLQVSFSRIIASSRSLGVAVFQCCSGAGPNRL